MCILNCTPHSPFCSFENMKNFLKKTLEDVNLESSMYFKSFYIELSGYSAW